MPQNENQETSVIFEGINYCFSKRVDERSLKIILDILRCMRLPASDINTLMLLFAATCAKHYKDGYTAALHNPNSRDLRDPKSTGSL